MKIVDASTPIHLKMQFIVLKQVIFNLLTIIQRWFAYFGRLGCLLTSTPCYKQSHVGSDSIQGSKTFKQLSYDAISAEEAAIYVYIPLGHKHMTVIHEWMLIFFCAVTGCRAADIKTGLPKGLGIILRHCVTISQKKEFLAFGNTRKCL